MADLLEPVDPAAATGWADALIAEFGSLSATLSSGRARLLRTLGGVSAPVEALAANRAAMLHALHQRAFQRPLLDVPDHLVRYLHLLLAEDLVESLWVLFLDSSHRLITDEMLARGSVSSCHVEPRTVIARAIEVGAAGLIVVHNHPSGNSSPSQSDTQWTRRAAKAGQHLGITLRDHIIVSRSGYKLVDWAVDRN